jgi:hypothetical protein
VLSAAGATGEAVDLHLHGWVTRWAEGSSTTVQDAGYTPRNRSGRTPDKKKKKKKNHEIFSVL